MKRPSRYIRSLIQIADILLTIVGFWAAMVVYGRYVFDGEIQELVPGVAVSAVSFLASLQLRDRTRPQSVGALFIQQFCQGAGLGLILQALFSYGLVIRRMPVLTVFGNLLATLLITVATKLFYEPLLHTRSALLVVGYDPTARDVIKARQTEIVGIVGPAESVPAGLPYLGEIDQLDQVMDATQANQILVCIRNWRECISPAQLIRYRMRGVILRDLPHSYEEELHRVCSSYLEPGDLILSPALRADSRTMAIQAVYINLIGLFLLLATSPVLLLLSILVKIGPGPGPVFDSSCCLGFQKIPYDLLRFRTNRTDLSGAPTWIGRLILRLHLVNLPQLINIVRGDMSLFGPPPVRREFVERMATFMPYYSHRFSVKPGILGWGRAFRRYESEIPDEAVQIEYDLYYIKIGSPLLDMEILSHILFGGGKHSGIMSPAGPRATD